MHEFYPLGGKASARGESAPLALERGYNEEEIRQILAFLERAMRLPAELEEQYERAGSIEVFQQRLREMMHRDEPSA
jgi:predicted nuclease with TOPRIM domain